MNRQRGFIELSMMAWGAIAAGIVVVALGVALKVQTARLDGLQARHDAFVTEVRVKGEAAIALAKAKEKSDRERKEKSDAENLKTVAALTADVKRLRDKRAGGSFVPGAAPGAGRADLAAFDRAELERALRAFDAGIQGLVDEGSATVINLDTAKRWAKP